jgi:hypothetical protein
MKTIKQLSIILFTILFFAVTRPVFAQQSTANDTAQLASFGPILIDNRVQTLRAFLHEYDSPLEAEAGTFIREADKNALDWRLVAAIAGTESTFGQHVPSYSFNAWGWGIPTGAQSGIGFTSWNDGIATVSRGLKENYINKGAATLDEIGEMYAASPMWAVHVQFFITKIEQFYPTDPSYLNVTI